MAASTLHRSIEMVTPESIVTRICTACKIEKPANREHFHAGARAPDGCKAVCKACRAADNLAHREERSAKKRQHYRENKERLLANVKAYYRENADAQRAAALRRYERNRDQRLVQMREYREQNAEELNAKRRPRSREQWRARYGSDLEFTIKCRVRALLRVTLRRGRRGRRMAELLGYTTDELRAHLERQFTKGMNWTRFMAGDIHIDHIIPVATFGIVDVTSEAFRQCWALANLRPAWAADNLSRQDKVLTLL